MFFSFGIAGLAGGWAERVLWGVPVLACADAVSLSSHSALKGVPFFRRLRADLTPPEDGVGALASTADIFRGRRFVCSYCLGIIEILE